MESSFIRNKVSLTKQVYAELLELLKQIVAEGGTMMPPEPELCKRLQVSRDTLRSAVLILERDGLISRVQGKGTYINTLATNVRGVFNRMQGHVWLLKEMGMKTHVNVLSMEFGSFPDNICRYLKGQWTEGLLIKRLISGDGQPAIFVKDYIPSALLQTNPEITMKNCEDISDFFSNWTDRILAYSIGEMAPIIADEELIKVFGYGSVPTAVLWMGNTHVDRNNQIIGYTSSYLNDNVVRNKLIRIW